MRKPEIIGAAISLSLLMGVVWLGWDTLFTQTDLGSPVAQGARLSFSSNERTGIEPHAVNQPRFQISDSRVSLSGTVLTCRGSAPPRCVKIELLGSVGGPSTYQTNLEGSFLIRVPPDREGLSLRFTGRGARTYELDLPKMSVRKGEAQVLDPVVLHVLVRVKVGVKVSSECYRMLARLGDAFEVQASFRSEPVWKNEVASCTFPVSGNADRRSDEAMSETLDIDACNALVVYWRTVTSRCLFPMTIATEELDLGSDTLSLSQDISVRNFVHGRVLLDDLSPVPGAVVYLSTKGAPFRGKDAFLRTRTAEDGSYLLAVAAN